MKRLRYQTGQGLNIQDIRAPHLSEFLGMVGKLGGSPRGSGERAVISKDVGNLFICVVVLRVLGLKVADDISLTPLLDEEGTNEAILSGKTVCFIDRAPSPLTSTVLASSIDSNSFTGSTCCWRMKSAMATTDLWPLYSRFIIIPLRNNFKVGYLLMRYRWAMSATEKLGEGKQISRWRGRRNGQGRLDKEGRRQLNRGLKTLPSVGSVLWSRTWKPPPPRGEQIFSLCRLNGWRRVHVAGVNLPAGRL